MMKYIVFIVLFSLNASAQMLPASTQEMCSEGENFHVLRSGEVGIKTVDFIIQKDNGLSPLSLIKSPFQEKYLLYFAQNKQGEEKREKLLSYIEVALDRHDLILCLQSASEVFGGRQLGFKGLNLKLKSSARK